MKGKIVLVSLVSVLLVLSFVVASTENNPLSDKGLLQTIIDKLISLITVQDNVLEQLEVIAEKETNINVTVESPSVIVNPNITIPDKECEWETYSQEYDRDTYFFAGDGKSKYISLPKGQFANEINVTNVYVLFRWDSSGNDRSVIMINGVECLSKGGSSGNNLYMNSFVPSCLSAFKVGLNHIYIDNLEQSGGYIGIKSMWLEMKVKPANC
jgi:hypothetical protein